MIDHPFWRPHAVVLVLMALILISHLTFLDLTTLASATVGHVLAGAVLSILLIYKLARSHQDEEHQVPIPGPGPDDLRRAKWDNYGHCKEHGLSHRSFSTAVAGLAEVASRMRFIVPSALFRKVLIAA